VLLMTTAVAISTPSRAASPAETLLASPRPLVIGHRGYPSIAPENTLASFERALQAGVDLVELDYHHSADGIPVVIHDGTLDRTTDAIARWSGKDLPVQGRSAAELVTLNTGAWFKPPFLGQKLPTLQAALDLIQSRGITLIERKGGDPATLSKLLAERNLLNQLVVQSFDWQFLRGFHQLQPTQVLGALGPAGSRAGRRLTDAEKALSRTWLDEVKATGARIAVWNRQVDAAAVKEAHGLGLQVWVYTINELDVAASLLEAGVDGIITDNPALIWKALAIHGRASRP
jgi:glycerophosphoryl diester phosphodiesterase